MRFAAMLVYVAMMPRFRHTPCLLPRCLHAAFDDARHAATPDTFRDDKARCADDFI